MGRTNIDIDDEVMRRVQARYGLRTKREAVDFALRRLLVEPFTRQEALAAEGSGWDGDLDELRARTVPGRGSSSTRPHGRGSAHERLAEALAAAAAGDPGAVLSSPPEDGHERARPPARGTRGARNGDSDPG